MRLAPERVRIVLVLALLNGCIYTQSRSTARVANDDARLSASVVVEGIDSANLRIRTVVYRPKRFPLGAFFKGLARGDFKDALRRFDVRYSPSNTDSQALQTLLDHGFVPVLINAANTGPNVEDTGRIALRLRTPEGALAPIPSADLPRAFEKIDWKAIPANAYNTTVVVVITAAVLAAVVCGGGGGAGTLGNGSRSKADGASNTTIWNPIKKTTEIDYNSYLFEPMSLKPGENETGLLFFKTGGSSDWSVFHVEAASAP